MYIIMLNIVALTIRVRARSTRFNSGRPAGFMPEFDVTQAVRNWRAGEPNHGVIMWATNENVPGRDLRFASRSADESRHAFINVLCEY